MSYANTSIVTKSYNNGKEKLSETEYESSRVKAQTPFALWRLRQRLPRPTRYRLEQNGLIFLSHWGGGISSTASPILLYKRINAKDDKQSIPILLQTTVKTTLDRLRSGNNGYLRTGRHACYRWDENDDGRLLLLTVGGNQRDDKDIADCG